jgi:hypothetical protein
MENLNSPIYIRRTQQIWSGNGLFCAFLKNNRQNIWREREKSIPLHSLSGTPPVSTKERVL